MSRKKTSSSSDQKQTTLAGGNLSLLFRGLLALIPSTRLATDGNPSSVTLLFPYAQVPTNMRTELGTGHTHHSHVPNANFDVHTLYLYAGTITMGTFRVMTTIPVPVGSEIIFYDGSALPANEINSPTLIPTDPSRNLAANSVGMNIRDIDPTPGFPNVINLHNLYQNESDIDDRRLEATTAHLGVAPGGLAGLAARVFRLRKGNLSGFAGRIDMNDGNAPQECLSASNICYFFDKHDGTRYPGDRDLVRKSVTDTVIFERPLVNTMVTVSINGASYQFAGTNIHLLLQHVGPVRTVRLPIYDIDFALTYRTAKLRRVYNTTAIYKERRIPRIDYCPGELSKDSKDSKDSKSGDFGTLAIKPIICSMSMYSGDYNA